MKLFSPNELLEAAKRHVLNGTDPKSKEDWQRVMNFMAFNVHESVALSACRLLASIYDMPLTESEVKQIVEFQLKSKSETKPQA